VQILALVLPFLCFLLFADIVKKQRRWRLLWQHIDNAEGEALRHSNTYREYLENGDFWSLPPFTDHRRSGRSPELPPLAICELLEGLETDFVIMEKCQ